MAEDLIKTFTSDFDIILVIEVKTGAMVIQQCEASLLDWTQEAIEDGYDTYSKLAARTFLFPEDRDWIQTRTSLEFVVNALRKESVYFVNYRMRDEKGNTIFYQMKYARVGDADNFEKIVMGGHNIDESERTTFRYMEEAATAHHNAVIASLAGDFDYIGYINLETKHVRRFHASEVFKNIISTIDQNLHTYERLDEFFKKIVCEEDKEQFFKNIAHENIKKELEFSSSYEIYFRVSLNNELFYYKLKLVKDAHDPTGLIIGLLSFDEQVRAQIQHREQARARELIEKQLEMMITERTVDIQKKNKALNRINEDILEMIGDITEARDLESGEHIRRVKGFTHVLAQQIMQDWPEYGLDQEKVELIASASALHDIGKIAIPDAILLKPEHLSPEEFAIMKTHTTKGPELLRKAPKDWSPAYLETSMEICHFHHEKYDGKGYPLGLKGDEIPISAQIVSVADCYDALTSKRVYKEAFSSTTAYKMISEGQCGAFSPKILKSFKKCMPIFDKLDMAEVSGASYTSSLTMVEKLANKRILYVESNEMNRMIGREMLEGEGAKVVEVLSGASAIEILNSVEEDTFDAVILDVKMSDIDGPSTAKIIRSGNTEMHKKIPIIAISEDDDENEVKRCMLSGMNAFLKKPIKISDLTNTILQLTNKK